MAELQAKYKALIQYFVAVKAVNTRVGGYQLTGFIPQSWYKFAGAQDETEKTVLISGLS